MDEEKNSFVSRSLRVFLSYSHHDGALAGKVKTKLELYFGLEVFLAHQDIDGGEEWEKNIEENLKATDIFIPLLSPNFESSKYTDQETGMAYALNKRVIPVSIAPDSKPYGFIKKIQALPLKLTTTETVVGVFHEWSSFGISVMKIIAKDKAYERSVNNSVIRAFTNSSSFEFSKDMVKYILPDFEPFDQAQVEQIMLAFLNNGQIRSESYAVPDYMKRFAVKYESSVAKSATGEAFIGAL